MRGFLVTGLTGPAGGALAEVPEPQGAHPWADGARLLVEVHAAGVSFPDLLQTRGQYQHAAPLPYVAGGEVARPGRRSNCSTPVRRSARWSSRSADAGLGRPGLLPGRARRGQCQHGTRGRDQGQRERRLLVAVDEGGAGEIGE